VLDEIHADFDAASPADVPGDVLALVGGLAHLHAKCGADAGAAIAFRAALYRQLNKLAETVLPLTDLGKLHASSPSSNERSLSSSLLLVRGLLWSTVKAAFLREVYELTSTNARQPTVTLERLKLADRRSQSREAAGDLQNTLFGSAWQQLQQVPAWQLRRRRPKAGSEPHFCFRVQFRGENVEGEGGPYRQFFSEAARELQGPPLASASATSRGVPRLPLFVPCPNALASQGENRDRCVPGRNCTTPGHLALYRFVGKLMGMAMRTGAFLPLSLPRLVWRQIAGESVVVPDDINAIDAGFGPQLEFMTQVESATPEQVAQFTAERLAETRRQALAIRAGLCEIVPEAALRLLSSRDLEHYACGRSAVDVALLRRHTTYGTGLSESSPQVRFFWQVLSELPQQDLRQFLRFAWAQERIPADDAEFLATGTHMMLKALLGDIADPDRAFPKADTCFFNVLLPPYSSRAVLRERLLTAIHSDSDSMDADRVHSPDGQDGGSDVDSDSGGGNDHPRLSGNAHLDESFAAFDIFS